MTAEPLLPARAPVSAPDGFPLVRGGGGELVPQAHGGALMRGGTPDGWARGGVVTAERRRARAQRDEAIDDAVAGHIEKLSDIMGQLVYEAGGEQYRCTCGVLGPKLPKLALREAADVLRLLMAAVKKPGDQATVVPIQVIVQSGGPLVPPVVPDNRAQIPTSGPIPNGGAPSPDRRGAGGARPAIRLHRCRGQVVPDPRRLRV